MKPELTEFQRHQLEVIARITPNAMAGHLLNTAVLAVAVAGSIPRGHLVTWCVYSCAVAMVILYRHFRSRGRIPHRFQQAAMRATTYSFLLALPWSSMAILHLGSLAPNEELILVALAIGMAASGTILLSALPTAAFSYMSGILVPSSVKCFLLVDQPGYLLLGVLTISYWMFLTALLAKISHENNEHERVAVALKESETRLQEALSAGRVLAFAWDPQSRKSFCSANAPQILGFTPPSAEDRPRNGVIAHLHPDDRVQFAGLVEALSPDNPSYSTTFRFVRPDGHEVWLEETGLAEFDDAGRYLRLRGLTRDITERMRADERQRLLVRELDHRVKNVLACVAAVAQRTRDGSSSLDGFLNAFEGRIQSMATAHALLSRSRWQGVRLADLVQSELAPYVSEGSASVEGPPMLVAAEATEPLAIVLHELITNALKYGALSATSGCIGVRWAWQGDGGKPERLMLTWAETGGPTVTAPNQSGYGTNTIQNLIPHELGGTVDLAFNPDGLRCCIELPSRWFRQGPSAALPLEALAAS